VCGASGTASAVLLRGGLVVEGVTAVRRRRGSDDHLCDGPGKLTQALGITGALDGSSVLAGPVRVEGPVTAGRVRSAPRVDARAVGRCRRFLLDPSVDNPVT
jgi:DNA-3-methyladenine glycosylase